MNEGTTLATVQAQLLGQLLTLLPPLVGLILLGLQIVAARGQKRLRLEQEEQKAKVVSVEAELERIPIRKDERGWEWFGDVKETIARTQAQDAELAVLREQVNRLTGHVSLLKAQRENESLP